MSHPSSAREALLAEAIGEAVAVAGQIQALAKSLEETRAAISSAQQGLHDELAELEERAAASAEHIKVQAVRYIARHTDQVARSAADAQTGAMERAARTALESELAPRLRQVAALLGQLASLQPGSSTIWVACVAGAISTSVLTVLGVALLWSR